VRPQRLDQFLEGARGVPDSVKNRQQSFDA
jgi:hypothetical protein